MPEAAQFLSGGIGFLLLRCISLMQGIRSACAFSHLATDSNFREVFVAIEFDWITIDVGTDDLLLGISNGFGPRYQAWKSSLVRIPLRFRFRSNSVRVLSLYEVVACRIV